MIRRLREMMATPFARPPGRRSVWARYVPEWCALVVYGVFVAVLMLPSGLHDTGKQLFRAAEIAYRLASFVFVIPVCAAALSVDGERSRGTLDSLLMTSFDHGRLVWGRFWHVLLPWLRFSLYLLPIYVISAVVFWTLVWDHGAYWHGGLTSILTLMPLARIGDGVLLGGNDTPFGPTSAFGGVLAIVRLIKDLSVVFLCVAMACWVSIWARGAGRALLYSLLLAATWLFTVGFLGYWCSRMDRWFSWDSSALGEVLAGVSGIVGLLVIIAQFFLGAMLVHHAARRFEAWALRETPGDG